jgi:hypothetical protein
MDYSWIEELGITVMMGILTKLKKDPSNVPKFKLVLTHIVNDACEILGVVPPTIP